MGTISRTETSETSWSAQFYVPIEVMCNHASYRNVKYLFRGRPRPGVSGVPGSCGNVAGLQLLVDAVLLHADHAGCGQRCEYQRAVCGTQVAHGRAVNGVVILNSRVCALQRDYHQRQSNDILDNVERVKLSCIYIL